MEFRWLTNDEISDQVNPVCAQRGWALLNLNEVTPTCRVLGAFEGPALVEAFVLQLYPILGPLVKVDNSFRDNGETSRTLAKMMGEFVEKTKARGYLAIADSPVTERLCQRFHMQKVSNPVYEFVRESVHG